MERVELTIDDFNPGNGISAISLVKNPAIMLNFFAFSKDETKKVQQFKFADEDKRIITGPVMLADRDIARMGDDGEMFNVYFSAETIEKLSQLFLIKGKQSSATFEHETTINGVTVTESWLVKDPTNDKANAMGFDVTPGSWMASMKIDDEDIWQRIKSGEVKGFSVEGYFEDSKQTNTMDMIKTQIKEFFNEMLSNSKSETEATKAEFAQVEAIDSNGAATVLVYPDSTELVVGVEVKTINESGEQVDVGDGTYLVGDIAYTIVDGVITEIVEQAQMEQDNATDEAEKEEFNADDFKKSLKDEMLAVLEKFGTALVADIDSKIDTSDEKVKEIAEKFAAIPGAEPLTPEKDDAKEPQSLGSWKQFVKQEKTKENGTK